MHKLFRLLCPIFILFLLFTGSAVFAEESAPDVSSSETESVDLPFQLTTRQETAQRGRKLTIAVSTGSALDQLAAFRMAVSYDESYLTLQEIKPAAGLRPSDFYSFFTSAGAFMVYGSLDSLPPREVCTLVFDVNEDAPVGSADVTATVNQLLSGDLVKLPQTYSASLSVEMERILSNEALLETLVPSVGELTPNFSPDVTEYTMTVPYEVEELFFEAVAQSGGTVRVNRKNLGKAGSETTFIVIVTSENKVEKSEYIIAVTREEKPVASEEESSSSASSSRPSYVRPSGTTSGKTPSKTSSGSAGSSSSKKPTDKTEKPEDREEPKNNEEKTETTEQPKNWIQLFGSRSVNYNQSSFAAFLIGALAAAVVLLSIFMIILIKVLRNRNDRNDPPKKENYKAKH